MGDNTKIRKYEESVANAINSSDLPIEVRRIVVEMMLEKLNTIADKAIEEEKAKENSNER